MEKKGHKKYRNEREFIQRKDGKRTLGDVKMDDRIHSPTSGRMGTEEEGTGTLCNG